MVLKMTSPCEWLGGWETLVSYSTRSLRRGLILSPGPRSPRSKAPAGDQASASVSRQDRRAEAMRPNFRVLRNRLLACAESITIYRLLDFGQVYIKKCVR